MFTTIYRSANVQNIAKQLFRGIENNSFVRCVSTTSPKQNSDYTPIYEERPFQPKNQFLKLKKPSRNLTTVNHSVPLASQHSAVSKDELIDFMSVFPDICRDLTEHAKKYDSKVASKWFAQALQYNVPGGKKNRGLATVLAYRMLAKNEELTPENIKLAQILGWCVEMFQSLFLITDDIMDYSETRRGQPCWYKKDNVGMTAINDALMIESGIYYLLKKHFGNKDYYMKIVEQFHEVVFITTVGQSLDLQSANLDVTKFTMDKYKAIVNNKTAYYSFYLPVALAMHMTGFNDPEVYRQTRTILLEVGQFFQAQDDFLDCFGDPQVTGKIGTDIQDGKCTWLAVVAMQRATPEQKTLMQECYGQKDADKVARVKQLYEDLSLLSTYSIYEEDSYNMIRTHIQQISRGLPTALFFKIMEKIYRRDC